MKVEITQSDIDAGGRTAENCPAALALNRHLGFSGRKDCSYSSVSVRAVWLVVSSLGGCSAKRMIPSRELCRFIHAYDKGEPVEPIEFLIIEGDWKVPS